MYGGPPGTELQLLRSSFELIQAASLFLLPLRMLLSCFGRVPLRLQNTMVWFPSLPRPTLII